MKPWRRSSEFFVWKRAQWERQGRRCFYCPCQIDLRSIGNACDVVDDERRRVVRAATVDHLIPRVHGGADEAGNCLLACAPCNVGKGENLPSLADIVLFVDLQCMDAGAASLGHGPLTARLLSLARVVDRRLGTELRR